MSQEEHQRIITTPVCELLLSELSSIRVGEEDRVTTFRAMLEILPQNDSNFYLCELKGGDIEAIRILDQTIKKYFTSENKSKLKFIGFDMEVMKEAKRLLPQHESFLVAEPDSVEDALSYIDDASVAGLDGVDFIALPRIVTKGVCTHAHMNRLKVVVWASREFPESDSEATWLTMEKNGVDIFTSDLPLCILKSRVYAATSEEDELEQQYSNNFAFLSKAEIVL